MKDCGKTFIKASIIGILAGIAIGYFMFY